MQSNKGLRHVGQWLAQAGMSIDSAGDRAASEAPGDPVPGAAPPPCDTAQPMLATASLFTGDIR